MRRVAPYLLLAAFLLALVLLFPRAAAFAELAAREIRYFWWLILILVLAVWLIWGFGRKKG